MLRFNPNYERYDGTCDPNNYSEYDATECSNLRSDSNWVGSIYTGNSSYIYDSVICADTVLTDGVFTCPGTVRFVFVKLLYWTDSDDYLMINEFRAYSEHEVG